MLSNFTKRVCTGLVALLIATASYSYSSITLSPLGFGVAEGTFFPGAVGNHLVKGSGPTVNLSPFGDSKVFVVPEQMNVTLADPLPVDTGADIPAGTVVSSWLIYFQHDGGGGVTSQKVMAGRRIQAFFLTA